MCIAGTSSFKNFPRREISRPRNIHFEKSAPHIKYTKNIRIPAGYVIHITSYNHIGRTLPRTPLIWVPKGRQRVNMRNTRSQKMQQTTQKQNLPRYHGPSVERRSIEREKSVGRWAASLTVHARSAQTGSSASLLPSLCILRFRLRSNKTEKGKQRKRKLTQAACSWQNTVAAFLARFAALRKWALVDNSVV